MIEIIVAGLLQVAVIQGPDTPSDSQPAASETSGLTEEQQARREERNRRRCRMEVLTGSRLPERACSSQRQEEEWEMDTRNLFQRIVPNPKQPGEVQ